MTTVVQFLQYFQRLWSEIVNVCKGKTIQAVCAHIFNR